MIEHEASLTSLTREAAPTASGLRAESLAVDGQVPPLAVSSRPVFSWTPGAAAEPHDLAVVEAGAAIVWHASAPVGVRAMRTTADLKAFTRYEFSVHPTGESSQTRGLAFETGPLRRSDWVASWISAPAGSLLTMRVDGAGVDHARIHVAAQGLVRVVLNGRPVNPGHLAPGRTARDRAVSRTYDLTDLLADGTNELSLVLGLGSWGATGLDPRVLAELSLWSGGVRRAVPFVAEDARTSPLVTQIPFYVERLDDVAPSRAEAVALAVPRDVPSAVTPDVSPPVRVVETRTAVEILRRDGVRVYDVGENISGRSRLTLRTPLASGTLLSVRHGEHLDAGGRVDTTNLAMPYDHGRARQVFEWVTRGAVGDSAEPWFAYYGFRYLEIAGAPDDAALSVDAHILHNDVEDALAVETDDGLLQTLIRAARRTALNNLHSVPEDCPTREQAAWTGDMASAAEWEFSAFDQRLLLGKWLQDLVDSQSADGSLPGIAPDPRGPTMPPDPAWAAALPRVLLGHWNSYADTDVLHATLPALRRWADYLLGRVGPLGIVDGFASSYGHDWLALEQTPPELIHTAAGIDCLMVLADLELAAGRNEPAALRREQAHRLRAAATGRFVADDGTVANGSQGATATALAVDLIDDRAAALDRLTDDIARRGWRASTGFATTRWLVEQLAAGGRSEVIIRMLRQPEEPGIGAMLASGPGTFWENWWIDPKNTGTGSLDHIGLGAPFASWLVRRVGGLSPQTPGWGTARFEPTPIPGSSELHIVQHTVRGPVRGGWERKAGRLRYEIDVPAGMEAVIALPGEREFRATAGHHAWERGEPSPIPLSAEPGSGVPWHPPALARRSSDIDASPIPLLMMEPASSGTTIELLEGLNCMPVPHAQFDHAVHLVRAAFDGPSPSVRVSLEAPVSSRGLMFAYAYVDQCLDGPPVSAVPFLRVQLDDGRTIEATGRSWPSGWNRVALDVTAVQEAIVGLEIGLRVVGGGDDPVSPYSTGERLGFHLGEVGFSGRPDRW